MSVAIASAPGSGPDPFENFVWHLVRGLVASVAATVAGPVGAVVALAILSDNGNSASAGSDDASA
jgi:hypothetical protein